MGASGQRKRERRRERERESEREREREIVMPSRFLARNVARVCLPCDAHRIHTGHSRVCGVVPDIISGMISFALTGGCGGAWDKLRAWISRVLEESATVVPGNPPVGTVECLRRPGHGKWRGLQPSALTSHASDALPGRRKGIRRVAG